MDTIVMGYSMDKSDFTDVIVESNQEFDLANFTWGVGNFTLSSTTPDTVNTTTPKPTDATDVSDEIY